MDIKIEKLPKSETKVVITLTEAENTKYEQKAAASLSQSIKIPGFREGKAPIEVVKQELGEEKFVAYMLETAIPQIYTEAVKSEKLMPISRPNVTILGDKPISIEAVFASLPEVDVKGTEKVNIKAPSIKVEKKEIDEKLEHFQKMHATYTAVDRKAKKGDRVEIDFEGFDQKGNSIPNTKSQHHPIVIGSKSFIPGFEEELVGVKAGEDKEFNVTFPKDYHAAELKAAKVKFKIKVHQVEEVKEAELNEETIEKIAGKKMTLDEFKKMLEHDLEHQKMHEARAKQEEDFFMALIKACKFEVSDILIEEETNLMIEDIKRDTMMRGMNFDDYQKAVEEKEGKSLQEVYKDKAEERVKIRFILDKLINEKEIKVTDKQVKEAIKNRLEETPKDYRDKAEEFYKEGNQGHTAVRNELVLQALLDMFIEPIEHSC
jgi:trigger factor